LGLGGLVFANELKRLLFSRLGAAGFPVDLTEDWESLVGCDSSGLLSTFAGAGFVCKDCLDSTVDSALALGAGAAAGAGGGRAPVRR
jgi:hypothetical protein